MATRVLKTRIQNKIDKLTEWYSNNPKLLEGEIAIVEILEAQEDGPFSYITEFPAYALKVGDGIKSFNELEWVTLPAADVKSWAKSENAEDVHITIYKDDAAEDKTLKEWFEHIENIQASQSADIAANAAKLEGHTDEAINTLITARINTLDSTSNGSGIVKEVVQTDGKVTVTKSALIADEVPELPANKIIVTTDTNATNIPLDKKLTDIVTEITNINTIIAGGVHFIGIVTTPDDLINSLEEKTVTLTDGKTHEAVDGDVVIQGEKEFIWIDDSWKELGDLTRIGILETKLSNLDYYDTAMAGQFVTEVRQIDGKINVTRHSLTSTDVEYGNSTVSDKLDELNTKLANIDKVSTYVTDTIAETISAIKAPDPSVIGTSTSFISTISQANGRITATKAELPVATTSIAGITKLGTDGGAATYESVSTIESEYIRYSNSKLYVGKTDLDELVFDCGGAPN